MGTSTQRNPLRQYQRRTETYVVVAHYMCCGDLYYPVIIIIQAPSKKINRKVTQNMII